MANTGLRQLSLSQLLLDHTNPRISAADSELQALQRILDKQNSKLAKLAEDIIDNRLSPTDNLLVVATGSGRKVKYIVLEGNRRLAALKILSNPKLLDEIVVPKGIRKRLVDAARRFNETFGNKFGTISCFEVASRDDAKVWIERRHGFGNDGSGLERWGAIEAARFAEETLAVDALDFVVKHGGLSPDQLAEIEKGRFITNLERLLETPDVRTLLGVDLNNAGKLVSALPAHELLRPLRRIVIELTHPDSTKRTKVTAIKTKALMVGWTTALGSDLPNLSTAAGRKERFIGDYSEDEFAVTLPQTQRPVSSPVEQPATLGPAQPQVLPPPPVAAPPAPPVADPPAPPVVQGPAAATASPTASPTAPPVPNGAKVAAKPRGTMVPADAALVIPNAKLAEIFEELKTLRLEKHRHAISVVFRVFLELSVDLYLLDKNIPFETVNEKGNKFPKNLDTKVRDAVDHMVSVGVHRQDIRGVSTMSSDRTNPLHTDFLHAYVHNANFSARENDLRTAWDNARPFFERIYP